MGCSVHLRILNPLDHDKYMGIIESIFTYLNILQERLFCVQVSRKAYYPTASQYFFQGDDIIFYSVHV